MKWPERLSFNDRVADPRPLDELIDAAMKAGVTGIGLHTHVVEDFGPAKAIKLVRDSGIAVTNYAAVGYWASGSDYWVRPRNLSDTLRMLDEAVELGTDVVGVSPGRVSPDDYDLRSMRKRTIEGIAELLPHARERNLRLAIEPVHPIFTRNGPIFPTLAYTLDAIDEIGQEGLGVLLDTYHVWWEPHLLEQLKRAGDRIYLVQVCDWSPQFVALDLQAPKPAWHREMTGEGCIDWEIFIEGLADYDGWWDFEGINPEVLAALPLPEVFDRVAQTFQETLGRHLPRTSQPMGSRS